MTTTCQHPGCVNPGSRKVPVMVDHGYRRCCEFRPYCAAHVPVPLARSAENRIPLPTHSLPAGQVHVPRVWEITGRAPVDRQRQVREWNAAYLAMPPHTHSRPR